ncbi:MAG: leucine-rich repeat protein [Cetobacterium sp.]|uniref:leucine-rich repeat protein n=1 Tax=Cetobacterium sp. TaxID=2071632 RepID=UPI003F2F1296
MSKKFVNLKRLKMSNTQALEHLRANPGIESVVLENSKILSISTFVKRVPTPLLSKNNMADYTQVKLNGTLLGEAELNKLKIGKMNVEHNDTIEVLDGALAGSMFTIKLGLPLNSMVKDPTLLEHLKDLLKKESVSSDVSKYELDTITWIGKDPSQLSENNYLGFFNSRTIGNFETFKEDLKWLPNLRYINLSGSIFSDSISLSDFENVENFSYSFADCIVLQSLIVDKNVSNLEGSFRNCSNLRTITFKNVSVNNANKSFHNCKGVRNLIVENPNMVDSRSLNSFSEALISETTFSGEPNNNLITSNILLDALSCSISIDLGGKKRPDLYNLTSTPNTLTEKLILNNTNITSLNLVSSNTNFSNLRQILADNTEDARVLKLAGNNIQTISLDNSSLLYLQIIAHETPPMFIDNSSYYNRVIINGKELEPLEVVELKKGNWVFNNGDMVKILDGPLNNKTFEISDGIIPTRISKMFPDEVLAEYIRIRTNKPSTTDKIRQFEIDAIETFGANSIVTSENTVSWFNGKTVDDWTGLDQIKNLKTFFIKGIKGSFSSISFNSSKITSLFSAFEGCSNLTSINFNGGLPNLIDPSRAFRGCSSLISVNLGSSGAINSLKSTFEGCSSLTSVSLPTSFSLLTNMDKAFSGASSIKAITMPTIMDNITSMNSAFEGCIALSSINHFMSLNSVRDMSKAFYGCASLNSITVPKNLPMLTTLVDAFNGCLKLTSLELNTIPNVIDITRVIENTPLLRTVIIEPTLTKCITPLDITGLDSPGKTISYVKDDSIIYYYQIKYHDRNAYHEYQHSNLDYSKLINLRPLIRNIFPCPNVAQAVAMELNKTVNDGILISDLHTIESLGLIPESSSGSSSWFSGKPIISFEGINHLINLKRFSFSQATSTPTSIDLSNHTKLENMSYAFNGCTKLRDVNLPRTMEFLEYMNNSFSLCESLVNVSMPINLPVLKQLSATFKGCSSLASIVLPNEMPEVMSMSEAFMRCSSLSSFTMPNAPILSAANSTFEGCSALTSITFRGDLNELYGLNKIFFECTSLTEVTLPSLNKAGTAQFAFRGCTNIEKVVFPELPNITSLDLCFHDCDKLNLIELPAIMPKLTNDLNTTRLDKEGRTIFYLRNDTVVSRNSMNFHANGENDFKLSTLNYSRLTELRMFIREFFPCPNIAEHIASKLSRTVNDETDRVELATITSLGIGDNGNSAFNGKIIYSTEGIQHLTGITTFSFVYCSVENWQKRMTLDLSKNVNITTLDGAFRNAQAFDTVIFPETMEKLQVMKSLLNGSPIKKIVLPKNAPVLENLMSAFSQSSIEGTLTFPENAPMLKDIAYACRDSYSITKVIMPKVIGKVDRIAYCFENMPSLESIENLSSISSVKSLEYIFNKTRSLVKEKCIGFEKLFSNEYRDSFYKPYYAFSESTIATGEISINIISEISRLEKFFLNNYFLEKINLTGKIRLGQEAFSNCTNLKEVNIVGDNTGSAITYYSNLAFNNCSKLEKVNFENITIRGEITRMFYGCDSLAEINLKVFKEVEGSQLLFTGCSKLKKIYINPKMYREGYWSATVLENSGMDVAGIEIVYLPDDNIIFHKDIDFHNPDGTSMFKNATLNYSNLNLSNPNGFYAFFMNRNIATTVAAQFGLDSEDDMTDEHRSQITNIGGDLSHTSNITSDVTFFEFLNDLPNLQSINFSGNNKITNVDLRYTKNVLRPSSLTSMKNSFRGCTSLETLYLPYECPNIVDFSNIISNTSQNVTVRLPAILPSASTELVNTGLDRRGITLYYYMDDSVTTIKQITYFPTEAYANCSSLNNCTDAPINLHFGEYINSSIGLDDSKLVGNFIKEASYFKNITIGHNQIAQGIIEVLDNTALNSGYTINVEYSVSSEANYDFLTVFATDSLIGSTSYLPPNSSDAFIKASGVSSGITAQQKTYGQGKRYIYICYRKDGSGNVGEDCGKIYKITINSVNLNNLNEVNKAELNYITDNPSAVPTSLADDETLKTIKINGKTMHPSVVDQIKNGEFMMPKHGQYSFEPTDGKFKGLVFTCNYKENMFEEDIFEAEIVK